jgi:BirA family biotin operon repressor/biotin-[acetyl-CoA-carboxylase] ligase
MNMIEQNFKDKILDIIQTIKSPIVKKIYIYDELPSTNIKAKEFAKKGEREGTIILAFTQKSGRGRFQRVWESPKGGLYFSIILQPPIAIEKITLLPLVASLSVSSTLRSYSLSTSIKWPNDVRVNKKKIAGILFESEIFNDELSYVILGIGVNLNIGINQFSKEIKNQTTSVQNEIQAVDFHSFFINLLLQLDKYYSMFCNEEFDIIIDNWKEHTDTIHKKVKIITPTDEINGIAYNVDNCGLLLVVTDSGENKKIISGDCLYFNEL